MEAGPYTPGNGAPVYIRPHGCLMVPWSTATPETSGRRTVCQMWRETVHGGKFGHILQGKQRRAPMLLRQMLLTGSDRTLPHRAPFDWATPQLSYLQMDVGQMDIQRRLDPHLTDRAKTGVLWRNARSG